MASWLFLLTNQTKKTPKCPSLITILVSDISEKFAQLYICINDLLTCSEAFSGFECPYDVASGGQGTAQTRTASHSKWPDHCPCSGFLAPLPAFHGLKSLLVFQSHLEFKAAKVPGTQAADKYPLTVYWCGQEAGEEADGCY